MVHPGTLSPLAAFALALPAGGQLPTLTLTDTAELPDSAVDQHGTSFTVTGLSAITHLGGNSFVAVMDNSDKLVAIEVVIDEGGAILSATLAGGTTLAESHDFEGIAYLAGEVPELLLAEESTPALRRYSLAGGAQLAILPTPPVFAKLRSNRGFECLTRTAKGASLWTANEEALRVDGPSSSPDAATHVRLLRYDAAFAPAQQFAYSVEPMHGPSFEGGVGQNGLSELVALPGGALLALERSLAFTAPLYLSRVFLLDASGATDVSALDSLEDASFTPVAKTLLWSSGEAGNLEGLTLGRSLPDGNWSLVGVVDDGDPLSTNQVVAFVLEGFDPTPREGGSGFGPLHCARDCEQDLRSR